jgi:hypothetical protein
VVNPPSIEDALTLSQVVPVSAAQQQTPLALTNSERTTLSQLKARRRLVQKGLMHPAGSQQVNAKRVVINYAKAMAAEGDEGNTSTTAPDDRF